LAPQEPAFHLLDRCLLPNSPLVTDVASSTAGQNNIAMSLSLYH
jgi:hypothetical protein